MPDHPYVPPTYDPDRDAVRPRVHEASFADDLTAYLVAVGDQIGTQAERAAKLAARQARVSATLLQISQVPVATLVNRVPRTEVVAIAILHRRYRSHQAASPPVAATSTTRRQRRKQGRSQQGRAAQSKRGRSVPTEADLARLLAFAHSLSPQDAGTSDRTAVRRHAAQARRIAALEERIRQQRLSRRDRQWIWLLQEGARGDGQAVKRLRQIQAGERREMPEPQAQASHIGHRSPEELRSAIADRAERAWVSHWDGTIAPSIEVLDRTPDPGAIPCARGRILAHGGCVLPMGVTADELAATLLVPAAGVDVRRPIGHIIVSWHDDIRHELSDADRIWTARAVLSARGLHPETTPWVLVDHEDDGRLHLAYGRVVDGQIHEMPYHIPVGVAGDAIIDRIATGRERPGEDAAPLHDTRCYASFAAISDGETDHRVAAWRTPGAPARLDSIPMSPDEMVKRIAEWAGPPSPGISLYGAAMSLDKRSVTASDAVRFTRYLLG